jgi:hypothetical protein
MPGICQDISVGGNAGVDGWFSRWKYLIPKNLI